MDFIQLQFATLNSRLDGFDRQFAASRVRDDRVARRLQRLDACLEIEFPSEIDTSGDSDV